MLRVIASKVKRAKLVNNHRKGGPPRAIRYFPQRSTSSSAGLTLLFMPTPLAKLAGRGVSSAGLTPLFMPTSLAKRGVGVPAVGRDAEPNHVVPKFSHHSLDTRMAFLLQAPQLLHLLDQRAISPGL